MGWGWDNILPDEFDTFIQYLRLQKTITVSRFGWKSSNWICPVIVSLFVIPLCKIQSPGQISWRNQAGFTLSRIASIGFFKMFHVKKIQWKPIQYNFRILLTCSIFLRSIKLCYIAFSQIVLELWILRNSVFGCWHFLTHCLTS